MSVEQSTARPASLTREISPPPIRKVTCSSTQSPAHANILDFSLESGQNKPSLAAVEAGEIEIDDHVEYFARHLGRVVRHSTTPRLSIKAFTSLYMRNEHPNGCHFVVHQHDHPIAGVHYDLRLQFSKTSSISFAIPYGLPGNPNSKRPSRMAIETRVHNLWNHLVESCSHASGSMLIWDTGEYEVIPSTIEHPEFTDGEESDDQNPSTSKLLSQSERLFQAFQSKHLRLRLRGVRLPRNYTISMRVSSRNHQIQNMKEPRPKRRRTGPSRSMSSIRIHGSPETSDSDSETGQPQSLKSETTETDGDAAAFASDDGHEDSMIRELNAYTGATNSIGSIHQRHWFLTLDRNRSGFCRAPSGPSRGHWIGPWDPFYVLGRDHERSVITGRNADEALGDDGVENFVGRKMWRPILE